MNEYPTDHTQCGPGCPHWELVDMETNAGICLITQRRRDRDCECNCPEYQEPDATPCADATKESSL